MWDLIAHWQIGLFAAGIAIVLASALWPGDPPASA